MKIGYDAKRAFLNSTGLGNYSRWLIRSVASLYPNNTYYLYTPRIKPNNRLNFLKQLGNIKTITPLGKLFKSWWRSKGVVNDLLRDGINIYHALSHELPLGIRESGIKSVVTIHDLVFMRFPQYFSWINRRIYALKVERACNVADKIVAVSQKTKDDIVELLQIDLKKIEVIYQGCDPAFRARQTDEQKKAISAKYGLPENFLLYVGTVEERKNLLLLAKALAYVDDIPLVVAGKSTKYLDEVKLYLVNNNLMHRVLFIPGVNFIDLPAIYQMASVFVYPSRYEGFGIPVLEALNSGVPVVAATGSCLEEAGGPHSLYTDPDNETELAEKINRILNDKNIAQNMIAQGLKYAANFDEKKLAAQLMKVYNTVYHA